MNRKRKILMLADWYEPGYKAGGPIRSCVNFAQNMKKDFEIYVFTSDRDLGSQSPYEGIQADAWISTEPSIHLFYSSPDRRDLRAIKAQIRFVAPDVVYLNSMFSVYFTLLPLWILRSMGTGRPAIVLSPRGMLRESALRFKALKKKIFLAALRLFGLPSMIHFHATDQDERRDIHRHLGRDVRVTLISNFPAVPVEDTFPIEKVSGNLSMIFIGRIHPIKNLDYLLRALSAIDWPIRLSIVGSLEDKGYWEKCRRLISELPPAMDVNYLGEIPHDEISPLVKKHHIFVLPTKGENFGHAIFEALASNRPVLISDQTPWRCLPESKAGWDVSLAAPVGFENAILAAVAWSQAEFNDWSRGAFNLAYMHCENSDALDKYRTLFS